jgi:60 kDa SS-A/Ro ribonucleoprotein
MTKGKQEINMLVDHVRRRGQRATKTPQSRPAKGREREQLRNAAGGYTFELDRWARLRRFLILGTDGGTYYTGERELTQEAAGVVDACSAENPARTAEIIAEVSLSGRAVKNDPAIFALALMATDDRCTFLAASRAAALAKLPDVCRIPTFLYQFADTCDRLRGWGRGLRRAVAKWLLAIEPKKLAYYLAKYPSRAVGKDVDGRPQRWTMGDLIRLSHPNPKKGKLTTARNALFRYAVKGTLPPKRIKAGEALHAVARLNRLAVPDEKTRKTTVAVRVKTVVSAIKRHDLTRGMLPTWTLRHPEVWKALLPQMPLREMLRALPQLTNAGLAAGRIGDEICARLTNREMLKAARIHPMTMFLAARTYGLGHGLQERRPLTSWEPAPKIVRALEEGFYAAFDTLEPTGRRILIAIDVSGSMRVENILGAAATVSEAAVAMALPIFRTERRSQLMGFNTEAVDLGAIKRSMTLEQATGHVRQGGGTDIAIPLSTMPQYRRTAKSRPEPFDAVIILTDNETWAGTEHPHEALQEYRRRFNQDVLLVVVSMTATAGSVGDPKDPGTLQIVGMDPSVPEAVSMFLTQGV